jgi:hypothetical protein
MDETRPRKMTLTPSSRPADARWLVNIDPPRRVGGMGAGEKPVQHRLAPDLRSPTQLRGCSVASKFLGNAKRCQPVVNSDQFNGDHRVMMS